MLRDPLFRSHPPRLPPWPVLEKPFLKKKHRLHPGTTQMFGDPSEEPGPKLLTITPTFPSQHSSLHLAQGLSCDLRHKILVNTLPSHCCQT